MIEYGGVVVANIVDRSDAVSGWNACVLSAKYPTSTGKRNVPASAAADARAADRDGPPGRKWALSAE